MAGQPLPFSRMTAATVPLQAQYGEVSFTRRSKPALTTAAQRCSWVRMFSAHGGEGRGGGPTGHAPPLTTGVRSTGAHLPTLRSLGGEGLLGAFGDSGRETRGWVAMGARVCPLLLCPSGSQGAPLLGGVIFLKPIPGCPSSRPCPLDGQASKDISARIRSHAPPQLPTGLVLMPNGLCSNPAYPHTGFQPPPPAGAQSLSHSVTDPLPGPSSWLWM